MQVNANETETAPPSENFAAASLTSSKQTLAEQENSTPVATELAARAPKQPKHTRLRYWTSFEEMRLIELWRIHFHDIDTYDRNGPIYRIIAEGMRERQVHLNAQECRRHINSFRNKYLSECKRLQTAGQNATSDWRLWPLVHSIFEPRPRPEGSQIMNEQQLLNHIDRTLNTVRPPQQTSLDTTQKRHKRIQFAYDPLGCPFLEENALDEGLAPTKKTVLESHRNIPAISNGTTRLPLQTTNNAQLIPVPQYATQRPPPFPLPQRYNRRIRLLPGRSYITHAHIDLLRAENRKLEAKRDDDQKQLAIKESELHQLQCLVQAMQSQNEKLIELCT